MTALRRARGIRRLFELLARPGAPPRVRGWRTTGSEEGTRSAIDLQVAPCDEARFFAQQKLDRECDIV